MSAYRRIVLASRPKGAPTSSNFRLEEGPIPVAEEGQVLLRTQYLSLDPYMRGQMNVATSYPIEIGSTMARRSCSRHTRSIVLVTWSWQ